jgi:hypothetical protein
VLIPSYRHSMAQASAIATLEQKFGANFRSPPD